MEQLQKTTAKSEYFKSLGSQTYHINRMSSHTDKAPDKFISSTTHRPSQDKHSDKISTHPVKSHSPENRLHHGQDKTKHKRKDLADGGEIRTHKGHKSDAELKLNIQHTQGQDNVENNRVSPKQNKKVQNLKLRPDTKFNFGHTEKVGEDLPPDNACGSSDGYAQDEIHHPGSDTKNERLHGNQDDKIEKKNPKNYTERPGLAKFTDREKMLDEEMYSTGIEDSSTSVLEPSINDYIDGDIDNNLPPTAALLTTPSGSKVYVIGSVHFSIESQKEVANLIRAVQPDFVVLELCPSRAYMLEWDEEQMLKEAQNLNFKVVRQVIRTSGVVLGGVYLLMLSMTIQITKQLGVAPGGEFRTAYREGMCVPNCTVLFGDRPIQITLQRMLASLSLWQIIRLLFIVLFREEKLSKEEVENCKNRDVLERMLLGFSNDFPSLSRVLVNERDAYLTHSLQIAAQEMAPNKVVGVVGIGHLAGIKENWGKLSLSYITELTTIPPRSRSSRMIGFTLKFTAVGLVLYGVHKIASRSEFYSNLFRLLFPTLSRD